MQACHPGDADGVNKLKQMIIYEVHLLMGAISETCNIVVGLTVTDGKMKCAFCSNKQFVLTAGFVDDFSKWDVLYY